MVLQDCCVIIIEGDFIVSFDQENVGDPRVLHIMTSACHDIGEHFDWV